MRSILLLGCLFLLFSLSQVKSLLSIFEDRDDLSTKIDRLEKFYEREPSVEVAGNLALLYQEMDNRHSGTPLWHDKSLELFNTAIQGAQSAIPPIVSQHVLYVWVIQRAILYISMGKSAAALADLETALTLASTPRDISECLYHRGASFMLAGRVRDAMEAYRESLDLAPEQLSTYHVICVCHKSLKDLDQAGWCELEEEIAAALLRRTQARGVPAELRLVPLAQTHEHQESGVYWALHEAAEGCGAYGRAWEHLMQAHAVERASREEMKLQHPEVDFFYNATRSRYAAKWRMSTYTKDFFPPPQLNFGVDSLVPVFIVGLPRSGSTLLESFLDSHKDVSTVGENSLFGLGVSGLPEDEQRIMTEYFEKVRDRMRQERERKVNLTLNDNMATAAILTTGGVSIDLGAAYDKGEEGDRTEDIFNATQLSPNSTAESEYTAAWRETIKARALDIISNMTAYALKNTDEVQFRSSRSHSPSVGGRRKPKRIVDKMLMNYRNLGLIHLLFPKAVILHMVRDPLDNVVSLLKHNFADKSLGWTLDLDQVVREYRNYLEVMQHYRNVLPPGRILDISYEILVTQPEATMKNIIGKMGIKWDPSILNFHSTNRSYVRTSSLLQVREKLNTRSIGQWRKYAHQTSFKNMAQKLRHVIITTATNANLSQDLPFFNTTNWGLRLNFPYPT